MVKILGILVGLLVILACSGGGSDSTPTNEGSDETTSTVEASNSSTPDDETQGNTTTPIAPSIEGTWRDVIPISSNSVTDYTLVEVDSDGTAHYEWEQTDPDGDQYYATGTATVTSDGKISGEGCAPVGCIIFGTTLGFDGNTMSGWAKPQEGYSGREIYFEAVRY